MKALVKTEEVNTFRVEERSIPVIKDHELLIRVEYCGICGSDLHAANHAKGYEFVPKPIVLGHEISGTVVEAGTNVEGIMKGTRVIVHPVTYCGQCVQCQSGQHNICSNISGLGLHYDGGMAEYIHITSDQAIVIPDSLPFDIAALTEPLSVAVHAVEKIGSLIKGKKVLVQGCGIIGIFTAIIAKIKKADVTISGLKRDWESRLRLAKESGIKTEIYEDSQIKSDDFDYVFECSGSSAATENGIGRLKKGGKMVLVALYEQAVGFPVNILVRSEIDILTSYSSIEKDFFTSIDILQEYESDFRKFIKKYSLIDGSKAFEDARNQRVLKPILTLN